MPTPLPQNRGGGGFGGFTPNPSIPYPGGRVLTSDVQDASNALNFGGTPANTPAPTVTPRPTQQPTATPPMTMDPSGAGYASGTLQPRVWSIHDTEPYPSAGGKVAAGAGMRQEPGMIASSGGRSPSLTSDPNEDWRGSDEPGRTADTGLPTDPGMNDEPSLYEDPTVVKGAGPTVDVSPPGNDRAPYWNQPATPSYIPGGRDIANFGGSLTLGQLLNTPLSTMLYGTGRWQPPVQGGEINYAGVTARTPAEAGAADIAPPSSDAEAVGAAETAQLKAAGELNPDGTTGTINPSLPFGGRGGGDQNLLSPGAYDRATFGGVTPTGFRDTAGSAVFDTGAQNRLMAWFQSSGGSPNAPTVSDAGRDIFRSGYGRIDPESGGISTVAATNSGPRDPRWVFPSQEEATKLGLSFDAGKRNEWLRAHNAWYYGGG